MKHTPNEFPLSSLEEAFNYAKQNPKATVSKVVKSIPEPSIDPTGEKQYFYDVDDLTACIESAKANPDSEFVDYFKAMKHADFDLKVR
jgi:hypothetical protein